MGEKLYYMNSKHNKARVVEVISDKIKQKVLPEIEENFIMIKCSNHLMINNPTKKTF